ncbi:hypothetical protein ABIE00_003319 [Arthrobacter sp. OAP107]
MPDPCEAGRCGGTRPATVHPGTVHPATVHPATDRSAGAVPVGAVPVGAVPVGAVAVGVLAVFLLWGAGVGGGVHDGGDGFELFGGREDFQVLQAVFGPADEGALDLPEGSFGGFGAVLVDGLGPVPGDPGEEVGVVLDRGLGQVVFHRGGVVRGGEMPCPVQGQGDGGRGAGADPGGVDRGGELFVAGRELLPAEPGPGQDRIGQADPAPGFGGADPQPVPEELDTVPGPVIPRRRLSDRGGVRDGDQG